MAKYKLDKLLHTVPKVILVSLIAISTILYAEESSDVPPWNKNEDTKDTVIIANPTAQVYGHAPGLETYMLVRNNPTTTAGTKEEQQLNMCDAVKINYRILDIDGDWADHERIIDSIRWFIQITDSPVPPPILDTKDIKKFYLIEPRKQDIGETYNNFPKQFRDSDAAKEFNPGDDIPFTDELKQRLSLVLYDQIELIQVINGEEVVVEGQNLQTIVSEANENNKYVYVGYEIFPFTEIGYPDERSEPVYNNQFEKTKILKPLSQAGIPNQIGLNEDEIGNEEIYVKDINNTVEKYISISNSYLHPINEQCLEPPTVDGNPFVIGYYKVGKSESGAKTAIKLVDFLTAGEEYIVKFYFDIDGNDKIDFGQIEEYNLTTKLLEIDDSGKYLAKDYWGKPFVNGLRLDMALDGYNKYQSADALNNSIFSDETVIGQGIELVKARGIPLDEFVSERKGVSNDSEKKFFFIDRDTYREPLLIFKTIEGDLIPEDVLDNATQLIEYFDGRENAVTLQKFILNVRSKIPDPQLLEKIPNNLPAVEGGGSQ